MNYLILYFSLIASLFTTKPLVLTIKVHNIEALKGTIKIGVFNTKKHFLKEGKSIKNYSLKVDNKTAKILITDLAKGEYAISLYHDENSDNKCNRNFFGIPKEGYGFSNNIKPKFSAPKYKDCKFSLAKNEIISIKLIN